MVYHRLMNLLLISKLVMTMACDRFISWSGVSAANFILI